MNKESYLEALQGVLRARTSSHEADKIMAYYEQYFDDALDFGRTEAEVIEELGDPEKLAEEVLEGLTMMRQDLFTSQAPLRMIDALLLDIRVHLLVSERDQVYVTYQGQERFEEGLLSVELKGDHLFIRQHSKRVMPARDFYKSDQGKPYLLIEIPQTYKGRLLVKTRDSRIVVDGRALASKIKYELYSKDARIVCDQVCSPEIEAVSQTGRLDLKNSQVRMLNLSTVEGRIELKENEVKYLQAKSTEGRIVLCKGHYELAELENEEARIVIDDALIDDCHMENEEGRCLYMLQDKPYGLHLDLLSRQSKVIINGEKFSKGALLIRDVRPHKKEKRYLNIYARSSTGRIEIRH